ncbi:uncharacterized protein DC041_0000798 [Schistosoma bovis]|uniref:Protein FAM221A n=1 Tax=Schistosoma bovis TaxID=6184 RepID=A0A430QMY2_SCHBO|nr:uncharacterized protein DC041_0000798 [Schistosoma bovis]
MSFIIYSRIVGDDDNGKLFTPKQYEAYKNKYLPLVTPYFCSKSNCNCNGFRTSMRCDCGIELHKHEMIMETAEERHSRGKPIGQTSPYQAMGGLTGFSSLAPGITRMDTSGAGKLLSEEEMNKSITSVDNPFLRSHAQGVFNYKLAVNDTNGAERERHEVESQMRRPGESELDYYERRYQERVSLSASAERERHEVESQMRRPGESELDYYERRYQERLFTTLFESYNH